MSCYCLLLLYSLLLVFGTWFPLTDWSWSSGGLGVFLAMDILDHLSLSDIIINLLIYMPFGFLCTHLLAGFSTGRLAITTILGTLLSIMLEFGQTFLPDRFTSLADIVFNSSGSLLGALVGATYSHRFCHHRAKPGISAVIKPSVRTAPPTNQPEDES